LAARDRHNADVGEIDPETVVTPGIFVDRALSALSGTRSEAS
jgi:acyl CoA:acetate/3-ketoacid CoA transferase alpha subunit